jgi:hypothetical protein
MDAFDPLLVIIPVVTVVLTAAGALFGAWIHGRGSTRAG